MSPCRVRIYATLILSITLLLQVTKTGVLQKDSQEAGDRLAGTGSRGTISQSGQPKQAVKVVGVPRVSEISPTQQKLVFVILQALIKYIHIFYYNVHMPYISAG